ncbi:MAG TPA: hypothetical protein VLM89_08400 [Phycisphaerae bacterium]|nr:hypothetical protein [Phycisphaerae bacterium]
MVLSLLAVLAVGAAGVVLTQRWNPALGGAVIVFAAGVNVAACWLAFWPVSKALCRGFEKVIGAILIATLTRMALVGGAAAMAGAWGPWPGKALATWVVVFYLCLLAVETWWAARLIRRRHEEMDGSASA